MEEFFSTLIVLAFSSVKFLTGVVTSLGIRPGLLPSYVTTVGGGIMGVFIFTFFGEVISTWYNKLFPNRKKQLFTKWNRIMVKVRQRFGLPGVAMLTPLLSVPVGIFLSMSLTKNKWRIALFMALSFFIWASFIFLPYYLFNINIQDLFKGWF